MAVNWRLLFLKPCQLCDQLFQGFLVLTFSEYPPNLICVGIDPVCTLYSAVRHHLVGKHQLKDQLINNSRFVRIFIISWWWNIRKVIFVLCSPLIVNSLFTQHIARKRIFALEWKKHVRRIGGLPTQSQEKQSLEFQTFFLQDGCTGSYFEHAIVKAGFPVSCAVLAFLVSLEKMIVRFWWWLWNLATIVRCGQSFEIVLQTWSIYFWFS